MRFLEFRFDPVQGRLWRGRSELPLRPKTLEVLQYLIAHPDQIVAKQTLMAAVWPRVHVSEAVLAVCVNELRRALGDRPNAPRCIRTVHRRGYHFIAPLVQAERPTPRAAVPTASPRIQDMWDRLAEYPARATDQALDLLLETLCELFGAQHASWSGAVRSPSAAADELGGWLPRVNRALRPRSALARAYERGFARLRSSGPDISTVRNAELAGTFRANRLCDLVPAEWFESEFYRQVYLAQGIVDVLFVAVPVSKVAESYIVLARASGQPPFTERERDDVASCLGGLKWFHRRLMLSYGLLLAREPLTEAERKLLCHLLSGAPEASLAQRMRASKPSVHRQVDAIYEKFGVAGRAELLALWLGD